MNIFFHILKQFRFINYRHTKKISTTIYYYTTYLTHYKLIKNGIMPKII